MYQAEQVAIILEKNDFRNKSYQYVPDYGEKFSFRQPYNPGAYKRVYGIGYGKRRLEFYFDYTNMAVTDGSSYITDSYLEIDECKLRSIIAYFKCSYARKETIKRYSGNRIELAGEIMHKQRRLKLMCSPFDKSFEMQYKDVILLG